MRRALLGCALALPVYVLGAAWATGCGDDEVFGPVDGGSTDPGEVDAAPADAGDAGTDAAPSCGAPSNAPPRLLLSVNYATGTSEMVALNLATKAIDGRLPYDSFIGTTDARGADAYLMQQATDLVARLDRQEPWKVASSWNVRGTDDAGGAPYADPVAVVAPVCQKAYVVRYTRNEIAVIDSSAATDAGAPISTIDLTGLVQAADSDGRVDMTSAVYDAKRKRLYVLLGNNDIKKVSGTGIALCANTNPTIIAIDTETDKLVSLGGTGLGGGIVLGGYSPAFGVPMFHDAAGDRLIVLSAGCNEAIGDGGAGAMLRRRVEAVSLASGQVTELLSLNDQGYPSAMTYVDGTHAAIAFYGQAFFWNPTQTTLGPEVPGGFDFLAGDGKGSLVGMRRAYFADGGSQVEVARVPFDDAGAPEVLMVNPFTDNSSSSAFLTGAEVWPKP